MGPSTTTKRLLAAVGALAWAVGLGGCPAGGIGACEKEPELSGAWRFSLDPMPDAARDLGSDETLPRSFTIDAQLTQVPPVGVLSVGRYLRGTMRASDPAFFGELTIPPLDHNNGSKTGAVLGCTMQINVPMATPVSDDNEDQGPLRIALGGTITAVGVMTGTPETSSLVMVQDAQMVRRRFVWTAVRP